MVVQKIPADSAAWERRGFAHRSLKQYKEAISDYTKSIETDPKDPDGYRHRAQAYIMSGDNVKAAEDFKTILKMKPDDVDAQSRLKALETRANSPTTPAPVTSPATAPSMAPPASSPH